MAKKAYSNNWEGKKLAFSEKLGVEIYVNESANQWCQEIISLKIISKNKDSYLQDEFNELITMLGKIIKKECPKAVAAELNAYDNEKYFYRTNIYRASNWQLSKNAFKQDASSDDSNTNNNLNNFKPFAVNNWIPPKLGDPIAIVTKNVYEYEIKTEDGKCAIRYSTQKDYNGIENWHIVVNGNPCHGYFLTGKASVQIFNDYGIIEGEGTGYFTDGYFTYEQPFDVPLIKRYAVDDKNQIINYLIDTDHENKIYYVGFLKSEYNDDFNKFSYWQGCNPFTITAVTENTSLFLSDKKIEALAKKVSSYANLFCPNANKIRFFATTVPSMINDVDLPPSLENSYNWRKDSKLLFSADIFKDTLTNAWLFAHDKTKNPTKLKEMLRIASARNDWEILYSQYKILEKSSNAEKMAYIHSVDSIESPLIAYNTSLLANDRVKTSFLTRIDFFKNKNTASASWPFALELFGKTLENKTVGWHLVTGYITPQKQEQTQNALSKISAKVDVESITPCSEEMCFETNDNIKLVRQKNNAPSWDPNAPPGGF